MADFNEAFNETMGHEGGYVNDSLDAGGETYRGIARKYNPQWKGWDHIDDTKPNIDDAFLDLYVRQFYEERYWDVNCLDDFPQKVANEMFDTGVNMGIVRAAKFLQRSLNYLNRNGRLFDDLVDDGNIGTKSLSALNVIMNEGDETTLLTMMNVLQGNHYFNYMTKSPTQEKYARGWFRRVSFSKK